MYCSNLWLQGGPRPPFSTPLPAQSKLAILVTVFLSLANVVGIVGWNLYQQRKAGKRPDWLPVWYAVVFTAFLFFLALAGYYPWIPARIFAVLGLHGTQLLAVVLVVLIGFAASKFKQRSKLYYGIVEVLFGMISSIAVVSRVNFTPLPVSQMTLAQVAALVGSVYVVARGFNNIQEAKKDSGY